MAISKPTFVLVPGAWHGPASFQQLTARLHEADYATVSLALPSLNPPNPKEIEVATDVAFIREKMLLPLLEEGQDVVFVVHSYAGCPGGAAAKGLSKSERRSAGKPGGIVGLVFITAFLSPTGTSLCDALGGKLDSWIIVDEETGNTHVSDPVTRFYADVPEPVAAQACAALLPQALSSFMTPCPPPGWAGPEYSGRRAYIRCSHDKAIPVAGQDLMVQHSGEEWVVKEFATSHSPFLSRPEELAVCLVGLAEDFVRHGAIAEEST